MFLIIIVHLFACIAHRLLSSNILIKYASLASCRAITAVPWNLIPVINCCPISCTSHMKGSFLISSSVLFWYHLISLNASVPGLYLLFGFSLRFLLTESPDILWRWSSGPLLLCFCLWPASIYPFGHFSSCHYKLIILNARLDRVCIAALGYALYSHGA